MKKTIFDRSHPARLRFNWLDSAKIDSEGELLCLWPTKIYLFQNDFKNCEWHEKLKEAVLTRANSAENSIDSNWKASDLFSWPNPACKQFSEFLNLHVKRRVNEEFPEEISQHLSWRMHGWANHKRGLDWHWYHLHPGSAFSFVYYMSSLASAAQDPLAHDFNGDYYGATLEFMDPRGPGPYMVNQPTDSSVECAKFYVPPTEGLLLIFPSFIWHMVSPMNSNEARISLAGNIFDMKQNRNK